MAKQKSTTITSRGGYVVSIDRASDAGTDGQNPNAEPSEPLLRHPEFYFDNTLIAIQIENTLFNVHKYQLVKSKVFSDMFNNINTESDESKDIGLPECPVVMKGITASDFASLLKILYASHWSSHQPATEASLIVPAFRVANVLQFSELRTYLLPSAEKGLGDVDKIVFAREFSIKEWLAPAHARLIQREKRLSSEEARKLQVDSVLLISHLREKYRCHNAELVSGANYCDNCIGINNHGNGYTCNHCKSNRGWYRCTGPSPAQSKPSIDVAAVEAEVTKWAENGFIVED